MKVLTIYPLVEQNSIDVPAVFSYALHQINGEIWCCCGNINIYSTELKMIRVIPREFMGYIRSVTRIGDKVAVAASRGVFIILFSGKTG